MTTTTRTCSAASPATATPPYTSHTRHLLSDSTPPRWPSSRRSNPSYHSHSSKSALCEQPPAAATTTAAAAAKQIGIPFLWEDLPGIPKKQTLHKRSTSRYPTSNYSALPLPPARPSKNTDRRSHGGGGSAVQRDPFLTALLECSKDGGHGARQGRAWKAVKKVSETGDHQRMGIMGTLVSSYEMSCKRVCGVSDSIVLLPGSARRRPTVTISSIMPPPASHRRSQHRPAGPVIMHLEL